MSQTNKQKIVCVYISIIFEKKPTFMGFKSGTMSIISLQYSACSIDQGHAPSCWDAVNQGERLSDLPPPTACSIRLRHSETRRAFIWPTSTNSMLRHAETQWIKVSVYLTYLHQESAPSQSESRQVFIWPTSTSTTCLLHHAETQWIKASIYLTYLHQEPAPSCREGGHWFGLPPPKACSVTAFIWPTSIKSMLCHAETQRIKVGVYLPTSTSTKSVLRHTETVNQGRRLSDLLPPRACSVMLRHSESRWAFIWPTSTKSVLRHAETQWIKAGVYLTYLHQERAPSRWDTVNQGGRLSDLPPPTACSVTLRHSESRSVFIWPTSTKSVLRHADTQWIKAGIYLTYLHQEHVPSRWHTVNQGRHLSDLPPPRACSVMLRHSESRRAFISVSVACSAPGCCMDWDSDNWDERRGADCVLVTGCLACKIGDIKIIKTINSHICSGTGKHYSKPVLNLMHVLHHFCPDITAMVDRA